MRGLLLLSFVGVGLVACAAMRPEYTVRVKNESREELSGVHVKYGKFVSAGGWMSPGIGASHGGVRAPIPKTATVEWRTPDGQLHREEVAVRSRVPRGFAGDLIFTIRDDGEVEFRADTWAKQDARVREEMRRNPPVFEDGELEIVGNAIKKITETAGLGKWDHPELVAVDAVKDPIDVLSQLAIRIKTKGAHYSPGDQVEIEGQTVCFREGEEGRLLVEPCADSAPSP